MSPFLLFLTLSWSFRDTRTGEYSPHKKLKIGLQVEDILRGKKGVFGKCSVDLNGIANDGHVAHLTLPLEKSTFARPPLIHMTIRAHWETLDGFVLRAVAADGQTEQDSSAPSVKLRDRKSKGKMSMFPTRKMEIEGTTYEMYENDRGAAADDCPSLRESNNDADTDIDFSCDVGLCYFIHTNH